MGPAVQQLLVCAQYHYAHLYQKKQMPTGGLTLLVTATDRRIRILSGPFVKYVPSPGMTRVFIFSRLGCEQRFSCVHVVPYDFLHLAD